MTTSHAVQVLLKSIYIHMIINLLTITRPSIVSRHHTVKMSSTEVTSGEKVLPLETAAEVPLLKTPDEKSEGKKRKRKFIDIAVIDQKREADGRFAATVDPADCPPGLTLQGWKKKRDADLKDKYRQENKVAIDAARREKRLADQLDDALDNKKLADKAVKENKPYLMPTKAKMAKADRIILAAQAVEVKGRVKKVMIATMKHGVAKIAEERKLLRANKKLAAEGKQPSFSTPEGAALLAKLLAELDLQAPERISEEDKNFLQTNCPSWKPMM